MGEADRQETSTVSTRSAVAVPPSGTWQAGRTNFCYLQMTGQILACSRGGLSSFPRPAIPAEAWVRIAEIAARHLLVTSLHPIIGSAPWARSIPDEWRSFFEAAHLLNLDRNQRILAQARELAQILNAVQIEPVFLKGVALIINRIGHPGSRFIGDIDLLIPRCRIRPASEALERAGYEVLSEGPEHVHDHVKLVHAGRPAMVEFHHCPVPYDLEALVPIRDVLARAQHVDVFAPAKAMVPAGTDLVAHSIAHAALHHRAYRLAWLPLRDAYDLLLLCDHFGSALDWPDLLQRFGCRPHWARALSFYLSATRRILPGICLPHAPADLWALVALLRWQRRMDGFSASAGPIEAIGRIARKAGRLKMRALAPIA